VPHPAGAMAGGPQPGRVACRPPGAAGPGLQVQRPELKYSTKTTGAPGLPHRPVNGPAAIAGLRCAPHHKRLISTCWELGKHPAAAALGLNRWTHMLGYRGHFLTKSRSYSATFTRLARGPPYPPP
jgi:hypothetical protein